MLTIIQIILLVYVINIGIKEGLYRARLKKYES